MKKWENAIIEELNISETADKGGVAHAGTNPPGNGVGNGNGNGHNNGQGHGNNGSGHFVDNLS